MDILHLLIASQNGHPAVLACCATHSADGWTPLMDAAEEGERREVERVADAGDDANAAKKDG